MADETVETIKANVLYEEVFGLASLQFGFDAAMVHTILSPSVSSSCRVGSKEIAFIMHAEIQYRQSL